MQNQAQYHQAILNLRALMDRANSLLTELENAGCPPCRILNPDDRDRVDKAVTTKLDGIVKASAAVVQDYAALLGGKGAA